MPRDIDTTFTSEKNAQTNKPIFLYTVYDYDGNNKNLNFAEYDSDVVYDDITYSAFPITHEVISENISGEIPSVNVTISNISRFLQAHLEAYDFRNKKVSIKQVWADQLADTDAYIEDVYYIDSYTAGEAHVGFVLTSKLDILSVSIPARHYSRNYCQWKFKSTECGYSSSETACNKTLTRCRELSNQERFGGFPAIPSRRIFGGW
jgi:lambda family phage minor tail protein L